MKKTIRMNERELNELISESVKRVLNEGWPDDSFGGPGDSASSYRPNRISDIERRYKDNNLFMNRLIVWDITPDGYRVLVPPHSNQEMKSLEEEGVLFGQCNSYYTPMFLFTRNASPSVKSRLEKSLNCPLKQITDDNNYDDDMDD